MNIAPHIVDLLLININIRMFPFTIHCPVLRNFSSTSPVTPEDVAFITRHPGLECIILNGRAADPENLPGPIHLPNLTMLICSSVFISSFAPGSPLTHVCVIWDRILPSPHPEIVFKSLAECATHVTSLDCHGWNQSVDMFPYVGQNLSRLERLSITTRRPRNFAKEVSCYAFI
jgi:hypothetical protein